jgi:hypothetical protein
MWRFRGVQFARLVAPVAAALLWSAAMPLSSFANPARIRLKAEGSPVKVGSTIPLVVEFIDQDFLPAKNDRERTVRFDVLKTGGKQEGRGVVAPSFMKIPGGLSTISAARFTAEAAGTVLVRVTSDGLAPAEVVVRITSVSSALSRLLFPAVHAQEPGTFELLPRNHQPFPRNGKSTAQFSISVDIPAGSKRVSWRIDTDPAVPIKHGDRSNTGSAIISIEAGQYLSEPFDILPPSRPGSVRIRAQALPAGRADEVAVEFVAPHPVRVSFEHASYKANSDDTVIPLNLHLLDKDDIQLEDVAEPRRIQLESAGGSSTKFEPPTVTLSGTQAEGTSNLRLPGFRFGRDLKVLAEGEALTTGVAEITVAASHIAVLLIAILGGFLGGVSRHVYVVGTPRMLPRRMKDRLDPGLVGNALLSALSGVVVFLAIDLGILRGVLSLEAVHDTAALGFVLGVAGGFAGVRAFEAITERILSRKMAVGT